MEKAERWRNKNKENGRRKNTLIGKQTEGKKKTQIQLKTRRTAKETKETVEEVKYLMEGDRESKANKGKCEGG